MTKLLWMWTAMCAIQCCWRIKSIVLHTLACKNMEMLSDAVIAYAKALILEGEKQKVQWAVETVCKCLMELEDNVWKLEDMIPAQLYFELWPYIEREKNIWQMFI